MPFYERLGSAAPWLRLPSVLLLALGWAAGCAGQAVPVPAAALDLGSLITGTCEEIHRYAENTVGRNVVQSTIESAVLCLESMLGQENFYAMAMFMQMVIQFLAEGAASGLNVIAVYVTEILRVTGIDVPLPFPRFTPEGVTAVAQWGLLALLGYWVLTVALRLLIGVLRRVFWVLKMVAALWLFGLIVSDGGAPADTTAVRLGSLVLGCALLSLAGPGSGSEKTAAVDNRLSDLEGRLRAVERRKEDE